MPKFTHKIPLCPKFENLKYLFIQFIDENFINFSLIVHKKPLSIPNFKKEEFNDNINFSGTMLLLGRNVVYEILKIMGKKGF